MAEEAEEGRKPFKASISTSARAAIAPTSVDLRTNK